LFEHEIIRKNVNRKITPLPQPLSTGGEGKPAFEGNRAGIFHSRREYRSVENSPSPNPPSPHPLRDFPHKGKKKEKEFLGGNPPPSEGLG
jgi:hypothetical protein